MSARTKRIWMPRDFEWSASFSSVRAVSYSFSKVVTRESRRSFSLSSDWCGYPPLKKKYQVKQQQKCIRSRHRHRQTDRHKVRRSWTLYIWSKILRFTDDIVRTPQTTTVSQSVTDTIVFSRFLPFLRRRRFTAPGIFFLNGERSVSVPRHFCFWIGSP